MLLDLDLETNGRRMGAFVYRVDQTDIVQPSPGEREGGREGGREGAMKNRNSFFSKWQQRSLK